MHICTVTPISKSVGANRIVPGISIPHPTGKPTVSAKEEKEIRKKLIRRALEALSTDISGQTIFEIKD